MRDDALIKALGDKVDDLRRRGWSLTMNNGRITAVKLWLTDDDMVALVKDERERPRGLCFVPDNIYTLLDDRIDRDRTDAQIALDDEKDEPEKELMRTRRSAAQFAGERFIKLCEAAARDAVYGTGGPMICVPEADTYYEDLLPAVKAVYEQLLKVMLPSYFVEPEENGGEGDE